MTAIRASLHNQPAGMTGTVTYGANLSGSGWTEYTENDIENGNTAGDMPLEAVSARLTGKQTDHYDLYYAVFQNGAWTDRSSNGDTSGVEGSCGCGY